MTTSDTSPLPPRVALDVTSLLGPLTGVGVFVRELAAGLARDRAVDLRTFGLEAGGRELRRVEPLRRRQGLVALAAVGIDRTRLDVDRKMRFRQVIGVETDLPVEAMELTVEGLPIDLAGERQRRVLLADAMVRCGRRSHQGQCQHAARQDLPVSIAHSFTPVLAVRHRRRPQFHSRTAPDPA